MDYDGRTNVIVANGTTTKLYGVVLPVGTPIFESIEGDPSGVLLAIQQKGDGSGTLYRRIKIGDSYYYRDTKYNVNEFPPTNEYRKIIVGSREPSDPVDTPMRYLTGKVKTPLPVLPGLGGTATTTRSFTVHWDSVLNYIFQNNAAFFTTPIDYTAGIGTTESATRTAVLNRFRVFHAHADGLTEFIYSVDPQETLVQRQPFDVVGYVERADKYIA